LAKLMGGKITSISEKGKGSEFTFAIPYKQSEHRVEPPAIKQEKLNQQFFGSILVVEDTLPIQLVVKRMLESMGPKVTIVKNGKEAIDLLEVQSFDLIFMDMQMPVMDGIEATFIIRDRGLTTPVYALSANVFSNDREKFRQAGCTGFLSKPVVKKELGEVVSLYLENISS
jgi:CheY-like chemotaxis protein